MSGWAELFLGVIAVATLGTAIAQLLVLMAASRLARRLEQLVDHVERELKPTFGHVNTIGGDAARAVALATAQVERVDRLFSDLSKKVEETLTIVQSTLIGPAREGKALLVALRAAIDVLREARSRARGRHRGDDEDALFI